MENDNRSTRPVPMFDWLDEYGKGLFRADLIAGLTSAAVVIPRAMAYATVTGLPVQVGLYTVFIPMVIYAVLMLLTLGAVYQCQIL